MYPTNRIMESIYALYQVEDRGRVDDLIGSNVQLANWLLQIAPQLHRYFHHAIFYSFH